MLFFIKYIIVNKQFIILKGYSAFQIQKDSNFNKQWQVNCVQYD